MIKSVSYDQHEIIKNILLLHCASDIELDPTYSKGNFYKNGVKEPKYKFDLNPKNNKIKKANAEKLPLDSGLINTIMFDPPFLATTGPSLSLNNDNNIINKRFGVYPNEKSLHTFYLNSLKEFYRILKPGGILIFKCQDKISSAKHYLSHVFIINEADKIGFYCKDMFILIANNRVVADWQKKNQKNSRKFHCYFLVLEKSSKKVIYL